MRATSKRTSSLKSGSPAPRFSKMTVLSALATFAAASILAPAAMAQSKEVIKLGKVEFEYHCTVCHGADGKGGGEMGKVLIKPPANLTQLSKTNGGRFPFWNVYAVIGGEASVIGHQPFEMPGFWRRFRAEEKTESLLSAEMRVLVLTHYVESLQE